MAIHSGHRDRVKQTYLKFGASVFDDYQLLELFLFYSNPRSDVNPLAHQLMNHFGSLPQVLSASLEELTAIPGVGTHTAISLQLVSDLYQRMQMRKSAQCATLTNLSEAEEFLLPYFYGATSEQVYAVYLDSKGRVLLCDQVSHQDSATHTSAFFDTETIIGTAHHHRASSVLVAHNHLYGSADPSQEDRDATLQLASDLRIAGLSLLDHLILADTDCLSLRQSGQVAWDN